MLVPPAVPSGRDSSRPRKHLQALPVTAALNVLLPPAMAQWPNTDIENDQSAAARAQDAINDFSAHHSKGLAKETLTAGIIDESGIIAMTQGRPYRHRRYLDQPSRQPLGL